MKYLLLCCAALLIGLFIETPQADAFGTETMNNSNSDGTARFVDPDEQGPFQGLDEGRMGTSAMSSSFPPSAERKIGPSPTILFAAARLIRGRRVSCLGPSTISVTAAPSSRVQVNR